MDVNILRQEAIKLHQKGFNVVPLVTGSKIPIPNFPLEKMYDERISYEDLNRYMQSPSFGNIGVMTGATSIGGLVVIDVDNLEKVDKYLSKHPSYTVRTPSGGVHIYYKTTLKERLRNGKLEPGVEIFGGNKYVVCAPSYAKSEHGKVVKWGSYEVIRDIEIAPLPDEYLLNKQATSQEAETFIIGKTRMTLEELRAIEQKVLTRGFSPGNHNNELFQIAYVKAIDKWTQENTIDLLKQLNERDDTPQDTEAVLRAVNSAYIFKENRDAEYKRLGAKGSTATELKVASYGELLDKYADYKVDWLVDGWLLKNGIMMLAAPPEHFKTWFAVDLAVSISLGVPFLGDFPVRQGKVLIVQQEDFGPHLINRFKLVEAAKFAQNDIKIEMKEFEGGSIGIKFTHDIDNTILFVSEGQLKLDDEDTIVSLENLVRQHKPDLVIVDPFYSLLSTDNYFADAAEPIRNHIKAIRSKYNTAFLFIHHKRKAKEGDDHAGRETMWGSQFLNAALEGTILFHRKKGQDNKSVTAYRNFKDAESRKPVVLKFNIDFNAETFDKSYYVEVTEDLNDFQNAVIELLSSGAKTLNQLYQALVVSEPTLTKPTLNKRLSKMPLIVNTGRGKYELHPDAP